MKIGYVIIREDLNSPVIQSQVIDVLKNIAKFSDHKIYLIWFYRIDLLWKIKNKNFIFKDLKKSKIKLIVFPFISGKFPVKCFFLPFVAIQWVLGLLFIKINYNIKLLHCRSYNAGLAGAILNIINKLSYIFDPRSPFPEEHIVRGRWKSNSLNYHVWKFLEKWIVDRSTATIVTSNSFYMGLKYRSPYAKFIVLPNNVSLSNKLNLNEFHENNKQINKITLCYLGSLGQWNDEFLYLEFLQQLQKTNLNKFEALFVILPMSIKRLKKAINEKNLNHRIIKVRSVLQKNVLPTIYPCTIGLQLMDHVDVRLSIKVVEYLAAGIPILTSGNVLGAADIVKKYDVGFILDSKWNNLKTAVDFINEVNSNREYWRLHCQKIASKNFSTKVISKGLLQIYNSFKL